MARQGYAEKLLTLLRILFLETSASHPMQTHELLTRLAEEGFRVERKAVYRSIRIMNEAGIVIRSRTRGKRSGPTPPGYYFAGGWLDGTEPDEQKEEAK